MILGDNTTRAAFGDVVRVEPPRGAAVLDRHGDRWFHYGAGWVQDPGVPSPDQVCAWPALVEVLGPMRLSR